MGGQWKFNSIKWLLITVIGLSWGYHVGKKLLWTAFLWIHDTFVPGLTEKQFERVYDAYYNCDFVVIFFAMFFWMFLVCVTLVVENIIKHRKDLKSPFNKMS